MDTKKRSGRPVEISTPALKKNVERLILEDRRIIIEEISSELGASIGTIHKIIYRDPQF